MRTKHDIINIFHIKDKLDILDNKIKEIRDLQGVILDEEWFATKNSFRALYHFYNWVVSNEEFNNSDMVYIKEMNDEI